MKTASAYAIYSRMAINSFMKWLPAEGWVSLQQLHERSSCCCYVGGLFPKG